MQALQAQYKRGEQGFYKKFNCKKNEYRVMFN